MPGRHIRTQLVNVAGAVHAVEAYEARCCGLTRSQCRTLLAIGQQQGPVSLTDLSEILAVDLSTVSRVANGLVTHRLITREPDERDRRKVSLSLTPAGRELIDDYNRNLSSYVHAVWDQIPASDRESVRRSLDIILAAQEKYKEVCCNE